MFLVGILSWWYSTGWADRVKSTKLRIGNMIDFFSIDILAKTLFNPYKQISANQIDGPINIKFRALLDRTISRFIGAMIRAVMIAVGVIVIFLQTTLGLLIVLVWPFVPIIPVLCIILAVTGWIPWKT